MNKRIYYLSIIPVMLTFFTMGFVDLVGTATNYVKDDFGLDNQMANLLPSMVFLWFLICSIPTGLLMNKIGRKNTVLISIFITFLSLLIPLIQYSYMSMMIFFVFLGIGNAVMQVSLNPLLSNIVSNEKMASSLTLGQFFKAIASFLAPIIATWAAAHFGYWRWVYPIYAVVSVLAFLMLIFTPIERETLKVENSSFVKSFSLLGHGMILLFFLGIVCHVGLDVGLNLTAPRILMERTGMELKEAGYVISIYFLFRTIGSFSGAFILSHCTAKKFFTISVFCLLIALVALFIVKDVFLIYACFAVLGFGNSNIFPVIFAQALDAEPDYKNEVSGLMVMGLFGGSIFSLLAGFMADALSSQIGALFVLLIAVIYLLYLAVRLK